MVTLYGPDQLVRPLVAECEQYLRLILWRFSASQDHFTIGHCLLDKELKKQVDRVLSVPDEEDDTSLDFSQALTQTST